MEDENIWWNLIDVVQFILILLKVFHIIILAILARDL